MGFLISRAMTSTLCTLPGINAFNFDTDVHLVMLPFRLKFCITNFHEKCDVLKNNYAFTY